MNRKLRITLSVFIALSVAGLIILVFLRHQPKNILKVALKDNKIEVKIDKVHYSGNKGGRVEWVLDAESAKRSGNGDLLVLDTLKLIFYTKAGKTYTLTAKKGQYKESTGEIEVSGNVVVESEDGLSLKTERLKYSMNAKEITTEERVFITSKNMDVTGVGLLSEVDRGKIFLQKNIKAVFRNTAV